MQFSASSANDLMRDRRRVKTKGNSNSEVRNQQLQASPVELHLPGSGVLSGLGKGRVSQVRLAFMNVLAANHFRMPKQTQDLNPTCSLSDLGPQILMLEQYQKKKASSRHAERWLDGEMTILHQLKWVFGRNAERYWNTTTVLIQPPFWGSCLDRTNPKDLLRLQSTSHPLSRKDKQRIPRT